MIRFLHLIPRITLVALLAGIGACQGNRGQETNTSFDNYKPLAAGIEKADKAVLCEGLPHQGNEEKLLNEELKTKKTVQQHGFPFYAEPLPLKEGDAQELTKVFTDPKAFNPFSGYKKCGGFHPDYLIEWHAGKEVYRCLVCFGCHEVKMFGPEAELYCDISNDAYKKLKEVLTPYRKHRPKSAEE